MANIFLTLIIQTHSVNKSRERKQKSGATGQRI